MLQNLNVDELRKIVNDTSLDYEIRIQADTEILRREKEWKPDTTNFSETQMNL